MKKKLISLLLIAMLTTSAVTGCGSGQAKTTKTVTTEKTSKTEKRAVKDYIENVDKIAIVKDAKNVDLEETVTSMLYPSKKISSGVHFNGHFQN